jgi:putative restriction endonuclease
MHTAYDQNILGVRPDLVVEVQRSVLEEIDGPMLRHGLQEMAGVALLVPNGRRERPDQDRLAERYEDFRRAG